MSNRKTNKQREIESEAMMGATAIIWGVYMIIFFVIMATGGDNTPLYIVSVTAFAFVSTALVWGRDYVELILDRRDSETQKAKRGEGNTDAALMLMELLSDDEKKDIRRRLMQSDDGEIPAIFADSEYNEEDYR